MTLRLEDAEYAVVQFWASKMGISENEFVSEAIKLKVRHANGDYDLPTAEIQRLNQLIDLIGGMSSNLNNLEQVVVSGFDSLVSLTRGDNYLLDNND